MKKLIFRSVSLPAAAIAVMVGTSAAHSAILTQVPVQNYGGDTNSWMLMPMVSYHANDGRIHVTMPEAIPQLTPLLVSNPTDSFDPADPWFDALDPSRKGAAFSRRYGFVMDAATDPLPAGTQMWIRRISGQPGLKFYRYSSSVPKKFDPIFGTEGVTNAIYWSTMMFHPVVTAPPGTNSYAATFEVFLLESGTGRELTNSRSGPLTFNWTDVSDGRPALALTFNQGIAVAFSSTTTPNWLLESAESLNSTHWTAVTNTPVIIDGQYRVTLQRQVAQQFFRMRYVP